MEPQRYDIILQHNGRDANYSLSPASEDIITNFQYMIPEDSRCCSKIFYSDPEPMLEKLEPVIGRGYRGEFFYPEQKSVIFSLHGTAIAGYKKLSMVDPRLENKIADIFEIYLDNRIFTRYDDIEFQEQMAERLAKDDDSAFAETIKNKLIKKN